MSTQHTAPYPTVEEILRLPAFSGCLVRGGAGGLQLPVRGASISDIPDYARWVSEGELLITTGYALADDEEAFSQLLPSVKRCGLSGVCIKPGRYLPPELPSWLTAQADELALPLIELPAAVRFSDLSGAVAQAISRWQSPEARERRLAIYLAHLLHDTPEEAAERETALEYGLHLEQPHIVLRVQTAASPEKRRWLLRDLSALCRRCGGEVWSAEEDEGALLVLECQGDIFALEDGLRQHIEDFLSGRNDTVAVCGISRPYSGLAGLCRADIGARAALLRARQQRLHCLTDDRAGLLRLIAAGDTPEALEEYVQRQLAPLLRQRPQRCRELLETLECWFRCRGNHRQMAQTMRLHYNTVSYRLQQLWQLLEKDPDDYDVRLSLELALYLYRTRIEQ